MNKVNNRFSAAFRNRMRAWYARHKRAMPWRGTRDAYRVWVSEIMLQQTRVAAVLPYYRRFARRFPTVRALARARSEEVLKLWAGLGYYSRARNLHAAAKKIVAKHGGKFPREHEAALALPGVGRYTAAAVLSIAYGEPLAVLDGNVARVLARLGAVRGDLRAAGRWKKLEERAQELMGENQSADSRANHPCKFTDFAGKSPAEKITDSGNWNQAMMELGATVCTPRAPRCGECPVSRWCKAYEMGIAEQLPAARKKRAQEKIEIAAAVMVDARGRTLLVKPERAETNGLFSRMWQFPAVEVRRVASDKWLVARAEKKVEGWKCGNVEMKRTISNGVWVELGAVKHSVTYREITLRPFLARVKELPRVEGAKVVRLAQLDKIAVSSATKKIAQRAMSAL